MGEGRFRRLPPGMTPFIGAEEVRAALRCSHSEAQAHLRAAGADLAGARIPLYVWEAYVRRIFPPPQERQRAPHAPGALLLSKREAAKQLRIDRGETLGTLIQSGQLTAVSKNGRLAIPKAEVERLAREGFDVNRVSRRARRTRPAPTPKPVSAWKLKI